MATATTQKSKPETANIEKPKDTANLPAIRPPRLPFHPTIAERFGVDKASWKALVEAIFPNATSTESVILALSYCRARKLDPFKRNVHIVPIWDKKQGCMVDTVWPGIGELRTTAFRTREYAGRSETVFGPDLTQKVGNIELTFPEWAQVTVYRMLQGQRVPFCGPRVYWLETYATASRNDDSPNEMWATRTRGQIDKCAEAAALRAAFPEEIGSDYIPEEIQHRAAASTVEATSVKKLESLEDLTETLEQQHSPPQESFAGESQQPEEQSRKLPPVDVDAYEQAMRAATTLTEINTIYERTFGPEAAFEYTEEQASDAVGVRNFCREKLKNKKA